jgi:hypothetical protein
MTSFDGNEDEMSTVLTDRQIERLLAGHPSPEAGALMMFVEELRAEGQAHLDEILVTRHVAACTDAAHLARPLTTDRDVLRRRTRPSRRRRVMAAFTSSLLAKVLAGSVALAAVGGTAATTGNLPDPAQSAVAEAASRLGISLPSPEDGLESETRGEQVADQAAELEGSDDPCTAALDLAELAAGEAGGGPAEEAEENACQQDPAGVEDPDARAQVARERFEKHEELAAERSAGASDAAEQAQEDPAGLAEERSGGASSEENGADASSAGADNAQRAPESAPVGGP